MAITFNTLYTDLHQGNPSKKILAKDLEEIYQSVTNIFCTPLGTRIFNPEFGSRVEDLIFEPMTEVLKIQFIDSIEYALSRWEPRVQINTSKSYIEFDEDSNSMEISLILRLKEFEDSYIEYVGEFRLVN